MKLGTRRQYAVMAMVDLTAHTVDVGSSCVSLTDIAVRQNISLPYLEQLFAQLKKEGLVSSVRGAHGGYRLSRLPGDIKVLDVISAVADEIHTTRCVGASAVGCTKADARCLTHDFWESLEHHIVSYLEGITLDDICTGNFSRLTINKSAMSDVNERCNV